MKKHFIFLVLVVMSATTVFAQDRNNNGWQRNRFVNQGEEQMPVQISGKLAWANGRIALLNEGTTYYVSGVRQLVGFVDGIKEGATVRLEGYAANIPAVPDYKFFRTTKMTINDKDYEFANDMGRAHPMGNWGDMPHHFKKQQRHR
jgi:hypothetical protein